MVLVMHNNLYYFLAVRFDPTLLVLEKEKEKLFQRSLQMVPEHVGYDESGNMKTINRTDVGGRKK